MIMKIQDLLYKEGLTISGVRKNLQSKNEDYSLNDSSDKILEDLEKLLKAI